MCSLISIVVSNLFKATMVANSTTMLLALFSFNKVFIFVFLALTHPNKMAKPNVSFDPSITSCAHCCFKHLCHRHIGLNHFALLLIYLTFTPPKLFKTAPHTKLFLVHHPPTLTSVSLGVVVTPIFPPLCPINLHHALQNVFFLAFLITIKGIVALTSPPIE